MNNRLDKWAEGFESVCEANGVDPEALVKFAQANKLPTTPWAEDLPDNMTGGSQKGELDRLNRAVASGTADKHPELANPHARRQLNMLMKDTTTGPARVSQLDRLGYQPGEQNPFKPVAYNASLFGAPPSAAAQRLNNKALSDYDYLRNSMTPAQAEQQILNQGYQAPQINHIRDLIGRGIIQAKAPGSQLPMG